MTLCTAYNSGKQDGKLEHQQDRIEQQLEQDQELRKFMEEREKRIQQIAEAAEKAVQRAAASERRSSAMVAEYEANVKGALEIAPSECTPIIENVKASCDVALAAKDAEIADHKSLLALTKEELDSTRAGARAERERADDNAEALRSANKALDKRRCVITFPVKVCPSPEASFVAGAVTTLGAVVILTR